MTTPKVTDQMTTKLSTYSTEMGQSTVGMMGRRVGRSFLVGGIMTFLVFIYILNPIFEVSLINPDPHVMNPFVGSRKLQSMAKEEKQSKVLNVNERYAYTYTLGGAMFKETGVTYDVKVDFITSLIHSFSPYIERQAARRFLDPPHSNIYYANSPALLWYHGELVLVARIWLDREKYEPNNDWPANTFGDNFLYTQKFDRNLKPITNGSIMGIPSPKQWWVGDGPIEPRLFSVQNRLLISFNEAMAFGQEMFMDFTVMWDLERNIPIIPKISGDTPMKNATAKDDIPRDKHWMAFQQNDELYFVHSLDPLRIMKCSISGLCDFIHNEKSSNGFIFSDHASHLRGGTPFELYEWPYYIGAAHSTMYKMSNHHRFYTAHLVVLCVSPYRVVYVSDDIRIHDEIYRNAPMVRPRWIDDGFIFPVSLIIETRDWGTLGVHVNDFSSVLIRLKGMKNLMENIIRLDKKQAAKRGPPIGVVQQYIHDSQTSLTNLQFVE